MRFHIEIQGLCAKIYKQKKQLTVVNCFSHDPTQVRTEIDRLGGDCPIQLCYGATTDFPIFSRLGPSVKNRTFISYGNPCFFGFVFGSFYEAF